MKTFTNLTFSERKTWAARRNARKGIIGFWICAGIILLEAVLVIRAICF